MTYGVGNDFFFSGHTAIAVLGATELARRKNRSWTALGIAIVIFEATTVLVLRAHYTLDVFTGIVTALLVAFIADHIAPACDRAFETLASRLPGGTDRARPSF